MKFRDGSDCERSCGEVVSIKTCRDCGGAGLNFMGGGDLGASTGTTAVVLDCTTEGPGTESPATEDMFSGALWKLFVYSGHL